MPDRVFSEFRGFGRVWRPGFGPVGGRRPNLAPQACRSQRARRRSAARQQPASGGGARSGPQGHVWVASRTDLSATTTLATRTEQLALCWRGSGQARQAPGRRRCFGPVGVYGLQTKATAGVGQRRAGFNLFERQASFHPGSLGEHGDCADLREKQVVARPPLPGTCDTCPWQSPLYPHGQSTARPGACRAWPEGGDGSVCGPGLPPTCEGRAPEVANGSRAAAVTAVPRQHGASCARQRCTTCPDTGWQRGRGPAGRIWRRRQFLRRAVQALPREWCEPGSACAASAVPADAVPASTGWLLRVEAQKRLDTRCEWMPGSSLKVRILIQYSYREQVLLCTYI